MSKKTKHISHLIRIAVAIMAFLYFVVKNDPKAIIKDFSSLNIFIFLFAFLLFVGGNLVFVLRWLLLLRTQEVYISYWPALKLHLLGLFYNNCLPGSVGGDLLRAWYVTMHTEKKIEAAMSVFVDRAIGLICTVAMAFLAYWLIPSGDSGAKLTFGSEFNFVSFSIKLLLGLAAMVLLGAAVIAAMYYSRKLRPILLKYAFIIGIKWNISLPNAIFKYIVIT